ncbi:MAG: phosphatase PAP2 family protein [Oscillospiraceae bacterium]|nr:phosphatase PAP2 family protein [Oscillospiraceae bacterium]
MLHTIQNIDESLMLFIQENLRFTPLNHLMRLFTYAGEMGAVWIILALFFIFIKKDGKTGLLLLAGLAVGYVINDVVLKNLVARPRPFLDMPELTALVSPPSSYSFPSGHAASGFLSAYILAKSGGKRRGLFYLFAVVIALSRPYVGVHYVSDVLAGALLGTLTAAALVFIAEKLRLLNDKQKD